MQRIKKIFQWFIALAFIVLIIAGIALESKMDNNVSEKMKKQAGTEDIQLGSVHIDSVFNYNKNKHEFQLTF